MNYAKKYDSLAEFYADLGGRNAPRDEERPGFTGATRDTIQSTMYAWPEPFERAEPEPAEGNSQTARRWSDYDGDILDMERMLEGRPCLSQRYRAAGTRQRRVVRMEHDICYHAEVSAEAIKRDARAMMQKIDAEEARGNRVEVYAVLTIAKWLCRKPGEMQIEIRLKSADEPLQIERLAAAMAPWFLRHWVFAWQDEHAKRLRAKVTEYRGKARRKQQID